MYVDQLVSYQVMQLNSKLNAQARTILAKHGDLSLAEWRVIRMIGLDPSLAAKQVRDIIGLDKGQFSKTVAALEQKGLIKVDPDPVDRRRIQLSLTKKGQATHTRIAPDIGQRNEHLLSQLSEREQSQFFKTLKKLDQAASDLSFLDPTTN